MKPHVRSLKKAFSLIELLMVMGILALLLVMVVPSLNSLSDSNNLTIGGQALADQLNAARQNAAARNRAVEFRLIKQGTGTSGYSAIQLWMTPDKGTPIPLTRVLPLAKNVVVSENSQLSALLKTAKTGTMPVSGANAPYAAIQVLPNGIVLPVIPMADSYLTIVPLRLATQNKADNYVTVQVNPITGSPLVYRP